MVSGMGLQYKHYPEFLSVHAPSRQIVVALVLSTILFEVLRGVSAFKHISLSTQNIFLT